MFHPRLAFSSAYCAVVVLFLLTLVGCGKETSGACDDIVCEQGECKRGICINPPTCDSDDVCLRGHFCNDDSVCEADVPCNDATPCEVGECLWGACVNPDTCDTDEQCLPGYECGGLGDCVVSPCAGVVCDRGVCEADTGECVNEQVCTDETEEQVCIDGFYCYGLVCVSEADICEDLDCERGICDPAQKSCVNAAECAIDSDCVGGFYCADDGTCAANQCDVTMTSCERGACDPETTECVNPDTCSELSDCTDGFYCVDSACVAIDDACGEEGCPGNQICDYREQNQQTFCAENPAGCDQALDCDDPRVCDGGRCAPPVGCVADALEPNDSSAEAVAFAGAATDGAVSATLCRDDVDVFTFNTRDTPLFTGTLVVDVRTLPVDVGTGTIDVRVVAENGDVVGTASGFDPDPVIVDVGALLVGTFEIEISSQDMNIAGANYGLTVRFFEDATALACQNATQLVPGDPATFTTTSDGRSTELGMSCTSPDNPAIERIFTFELTETAFTEVVVDPAAGVDLSVSLREECLTQATELTCAAGASAGSNETVSRLLQPGTYAVIVEPEEEGLGGDFAISVTAQPTICRSGSASCLSQTQSRVCNPQGIGYDEVTCDQGCDTSTGLCIRNPSDVCFTAIDARNGYSGQVVWSDLVGDYDPAVVSCIPRTSKGTETSGPDAAFEVSVDADEVLIVDLVTNGESASLYAVEDCNDIEGTCLAGANSSTFGDEQLVWVNDTGSRASFFVVADIQSGGTLDPADITIGTEPAICVPNQSVCAGPDRLTCNGLGTAQTAETCPFGCTNGVCDPAPNNTCATPIDLLAAGAFTAPIEEYSDNYTPGFSGCTGSSAFGGDAAFDVTGAVGEVVTVDVSAPFDAALYVVTDCSDELGTCVAGAPEATFGQVQFVVQPGTTYYAIVDSDSNDTGDFTVRANTQAPSCTPGDIIGCVQGTDLEYCSDFGVPTLYSCDGSCSNGACDSPRGTACYDPVDATGGFNIVGQEFNTPNNFESGTGQQGACNFGSTTDGADKVHQIDLLPGQVLLAEMDSSSSFGTMYLLGSCGDMSTCIDNTTPTSGPNHSIRYDATAVETVYLVTDRTSSGTSTLDYDLDIRVTQPCVIGQPTFCAADGQTVVYCDSEGLEGYFECPTGCTDGLCSNPTGETCYDPIQVTASGQYTGDFSGSNDVDYGTGRFGGCHADEFDSPDGEEEVYAVDLTAGETLSADLQTSSSTAMLFLMKDCSDRNSCVANNPQQGATTLSYRASQDETIFVVVDSSSTASNTYTLDIGITPGLICAPDAWACDSSNNAAKCDSAGTSYDQYVFCSNGCQGGFCDEDVTASDTCATAPDASTGNRIASSFDVLTNDIDLPNSSCVGDDTPGPDYIQQVFVSAGEIIRARVESYGFENAAVYIFRDCADPATTCVAGDEATSSDNYVGEVLYRAPESGVYYVAADGTSSFYDEEFSLTIDVLQPECVEGQQQCLDSNTLEYCDANGLFAEYFCTNGCSGNGCSAPTGESCWEPLVITASGQFTGNFSGINSVDYGDTPAGGCFTDGGQGNDGSDTVYAVDLSAGETVTADLATTFSNAYLYITPSCDDRNRCVVNNPTRGATTLNYQAEADERVYLIVDGSTSSTTSYTLDVTITPGLTCAPDAWSCVGGDARLCDSSGTGYEVETSCATGCSNGFCDPLSGADLCSTAPDASSGVRVVGNFASLQNDVSLSTSSCVGDSTPSGDLIYSVTVQADDIIRARTVGYGGEETAVYVFSDCSDPTGTCAVGDLGTSGENFTSEILYRALTAGTYYVAADGTVSSYDEPFALEIDVLPPECVTGETQCAADGVTLEYCDENRLFADYTCPTACSQGACTMPTGNSCFEPLPVTASGTFTGDFNSTNDVDYGDGAFGACFADSSQTNDGGDTVYAVELEAGETVVADLQTTTTSAYLYILKSCVDPASCQANNPDRGATTLAYRADTAETIFVVVDASFSSTTPYTLDLDISSAYSCAPNMWVCDGSDAKLCNATGDGFDRVTVCSAGCDAGFCNWDPSAAEACGGTTPVSTGLRVNGNFGDASSTSSLGFASCIGTTASAGEYFFPVLATAGDVIRASVQSYGAETTAVYLFDECIDPERSCSVGAIGGTADGYLSELTYQVPTSGTYYVAADATSSTSDEPFSFVVDVTPGNCDVGETQCNGSTLQFCEAGEFVDFACSTTCSSGSCDAPQGDFCFDAIPATPGTTYTGDYGTVSNNVDPANGACTFTSSNRPDGPDTVYAVTLAANDILTANLTTSAGGASLYVLDSCDTPTQSCVWAEPDNTSLQYYAQSAGTYYVVVDSDATGETGSFSLDLSVASGGVCQPGETVCDTATGTVTECSADGLSIINQVTCPASCNADGSCTGPGTPNNTCADAYVVTAPVTLVDSYSRFTNDIDPGSSSCLGEPADGPDAIYAVPLNSGDVIVASVTAQNSSDDASIYILTDCSDPSGSCVDGVVSTTADADAAYISPVAQTVYVVVDSDSSFDTDDFFVSIDFGPAQCSQGQTQCVNSSTLEYCNDLGRFESYACTGGCSNGACGTPTGLVCPDPIVATDGFSHSSAFRGSNDIDMGTGIVGGCDFSSSSGVGDDHFYAVDMVAGQTLTITYTSPGSSGESASSYGHVFILGDCFDKNSCQTNLQRVSANTTATLSFVAPNTQRYFVVVDRALTSSTSFAYGYTVDFAIQ